MNNIPFEKRNCDICKHKDKNASIEPCKSCDSAAIDDTNKFEPDYDKICKWCYNPAAPGDNVCVGHRESHTRHSWPGCVESDAAKREQKERRERIATAIMAGIYANPAATANYLAEVAARAVCGADALIALLDEKKQ